jgi:hypothetical protein
VSAAEVLALINRGAVNLALPRKVTAPRLIVALKGSRCCGAPSLLVRSRAGGFVAQDCLSCGKTSDYVNTMDIPDLDCDGCPRPILDLKRCSWGEGGGVTF